MARTIQKRKRSNWSFRPKKRIIRRRNFRRTFRRNAVTTSSRSINPRQPFKIIARKLRKRTYRSLLWRDTMFKTHYRSIRTSALTITTPNSNTAQRVGLSQCFDVNDLTTFWRTAGGLEDANYGVTVPWAAGAGPNPESITIRGGRIWISFNNRSTATETIRVRVQLIFLRSQSRNYSDAMDSNTWTDYMNNILAGGGIKPIGWDIVGAPDFSQYMYRPVLDKYMDLRPDDSLDVYWKIKPVKIDTAAFTRGGGWFPVWIYYVSTHYDDNLAADNVRVQLGHNISFAASDISS